MNPPVSTRLILLPRDPALPVPCLYVDAGGRILARRQLDPAHPLPADAGMTREVVVVPGEAVRALWMDLPARNPVQALAAARILLQDHVAADADTLHIAIDAGTATDARRLVAMADNAQMLEWLQRCTRLGVLADALIPDHLLAAAQEGEALQVLVHDGCWLVRGPQLAFAAEPDLARRIVGELPYLLVDDPAMVEARFAAAIMDPQAEQLDLLQYTHAHRRDAAQARRWRRIAMLALLCLLSPLLLVGAQALHHAVGARWLENRADALAAARLPQTAGADASEALHAHYRGLAAPGKLAVQAAGLFRAMEQVRGTRLDSLEYGPDNGLRAGLLHAGEADLDALRQHLAAEGLTLLPLDSQAVDGGLRTQVVLEETR